MKKWVTVVTVLFLVCGMSGASHAFFINFEDGTDGGFVNDITGVSFEDFNGFAARYGDSSTGKYNTHSDDLNYGYGSYHHNGNIFLWAGPSADARGVKVDFTNNDGTFFRTGYSSYSTFYIDAYFTDGTTASVSGFANYGSPMSFLSVNASAGKYLDFVVLHDTGNQWLADDMSGDASGIPNQVPEPSTVLLLGAGLAGVWFGGRRVAG